MPQSFADRLLRSWLRLQATEGRELDQMDLAARLAKVTGKPAVAQATVSRWFRGTVPDVVTMAALAKVVQVDPGWLAFGDPGDAISARPAGPPRSVKQHVQDADRQRRGSKRKSGGRHDPG